LQILVVASAFLVHASYAPAVEKRETEKLPQHVAELRDAILSTARSGKIEDLALPLDMSAVVPDIGIAGTTDPIKALKTASADGQGREVLAALIEILSMPPATLPLGSDIENNLIYVWPYLAERPLDKLTPAEEVDLYRLVTPEVAKQMREKKKWLWWRLVIGADGTWQVFKKAN